MLPAAHPNEFDHKRIERALNQRERYRYVAPQVISDEEEHGYRIESPCCSRNVGPAGGIIDIALLKYLNGHYRDTAIEDEIPRPARFPLPIPPPQAGEGDKVSLCEFHDKSHWLLYRKDHEYSTWVLHSVVDTLNAALEIFLPDEERVFWP